MSISNQFYDAALLSEVAYINFEGIDLANENTYEDAVEKVLGNPEKQSNLSTSQIDYFMTNWEIVSHQGNTDTGFSATLFKKVGANEYYYACRGTEGPDWEDLFVTDIGDIVTDGLAIKQIVDMYNDWQRITTPEGQIYNAAHLEVLTGEAQNLQQEIAFNRANPLFSSNTYELLLRERNDVIIDMPSGNVYTIQTDVPSDQLFTDVTDERRTGAGAYPGAGTVTAVGHSLGGHLATAFSRLFSFCEDAITINGAGFMTGQLSGLSGNAATNIHNLFAMLGGTPAFPVSELLNIYG